MKATKAKKTRVASSLISVVPHYVENLHHDPYSNMETGVETVSLVA